MEIKENVLNALAEEANVSLQFVKKVYNTIYKLPCVKNGEEYQLLNCIYLFINLKKSHFHDDNESNYILDEALYRTYKEESIPYLSLYYIAMNDIDLESVLEKVQTLKRKKSQ